MYPNEIISTLVFLFRVIFIFMQQNLPKLVPHRSIIFFFFFFQNINISKRYIKTLLFHFILHLVSPISLYYILQLLYFTLIHLRILLSITLYIHISAMDFHQ